jgi:hypothetical protein
MELLVAMLVTMIVSGAIYGLIVSGQTAFRRQPELAERQQNIRIAMDLIQRDVLLAGQGIPWFGQAFTLDDLPAATDACPAGTGLNGCGLAGTLGGAAAAARGGDSQNTDILEMVAAEEECPFYNVCDPVQTAGADIPGTATIVVREPPDAGTFCMQGNTLLLATTNYNFAILAVPGGPPPPPPTAGVCSSGGGTNRTFTTAGVSIGLWAPYGGANIPPLRQLATGGGAWITQARIARYQVAPDPLDNAPSLWRSTSGLFDTKGAAVGAAAANVGTWQLVARGIEDLQVEYMDGGGAWSNRPSDLSAGGDACGVNPPLPSNPTCAPQAASIVRQVRVTLSARSMAVNLQGETRDGNQTVGSEAIRGQLQAVITPRAAKVGLSIP